MNVVGILTAIIKLVFNALEMIIQCFEDDVSNKIETLHQLKSLKCLTRDLSSMT
jgi:hypothetical protein